VLTLHGDTPYDMNNHAFGTQQSFTRNIVNALIADPVVKQSNLKFEHKLEHLSTLLET
jgi:hypothetical protein